MPTKTSLMPIVGIDNRQEDAALIVRGEAARVYLREALNVDITETGRVNMRGAVKKVCDSPFTSLWASPLHGDMFGVLGTKWGRIDTIDWSFEELAELGGDWAFHGVNNGRVLVAGADGVFSFDGRQALRLGIDTPGQPYVVQGDGALPPGEYGVAISWLRNGLESSVSAMAVATVQSGAMEVTLPYAIDQSITHTRLYMTKPGSRELQLVEQYPIDQSGVTITAMPQLGASPEFQYLDAMPSGRYLQVWRGRLLVAGTKTIYFSEPMAWHLNDRRHGFIQLPQRITFIAAVEAGIWVGQVDHVVFLSGSQPDELAVQRRAAKAPVPGSAVLIDADLLGELAGSGQQGALWLAENGYVVGTGDGQLIEVQRKRLQGIRAGQGFTTVWGDRILTTLR